MGRLYDEWIPPSTDWLRTRSLPTRAYLAQEILQLLATLRDDLQTVKTCDFAMGWGNWALMAKAMGCHSYGTELSKVRVAEAKRNGIHTIGWNEIPGSEFDIINLDQVLEHVPEPVKLLSHLKAGLKKGGLLKFSVPSVMNIEYRVKKMDWNAEYHGSKSIMPIAPLEHINYFKPRTIVELLSRTGFSRTFIPLSNQYKFVTAWTGVRQCAKNLILPLYRNFLRTPRYVIVTY